MVHDPAGALRHDGVADLLHEEGSHRQLPKVSERSGRKPKAPSMRFQWSRARGPARNLCEGSNGFTARLFHDGEPDRFREGVIAAMVDGRALALPFVVQTVEALRRIRRSGHLASTVSANLPRIAAISLIYQGFRRRRRCRNRCVNRPRRLATTRQLPEFRRLVIAQRHQSPPLPASESRLRRTNRHNHINLSIRTLVLDPHFDEIGVYALAPALEFSQARKIRLLTGVEYELELLELLIEYSNMNLPGSGTVEVHWKNDLDKRRFPHLHDRFAIVDGALWHFGSTVGGGHHTLTAASGPWSAAETGAKQFFEQCWNTSYA